MGFDRLFARWIIKYRILLILLVLVTSSLFAAHFAGLKIITNLDDFIPQGHPYAKVHKVMEDLFGGGDMVQVAILVKQGSVLGILPMHFEGRTYAKQ